MSTGSTIPRQSGTAAQPVSEDQLYLLFIAMARWPTYLAQARLRLGPELFDPATEAPWQVAFLALCRAMDRYNGFSFVTLRQAAADELSENPLIQLTPDQYQGVFSEDANQPGILCYITGVPNEHLGPDTLAMADEILRRFLLERTIAAPLRRLMSQPMGAPNRYPADLGQALENYAEHYRRLSAPSTLPVVQLAPPPGQLLRPACDFVLTGLPMFDVRFGGVRRGDTNGIVGVTGGAKTTIGTFLCVLAGRNSWQQQGMNCEQAAFVTYEEPVWRLRPRFQSAAMYIPREKLETMTNVEQLARTPQEYELALRSDYNGDVPSEYDRYLHAAQWVNHAIAAFDLSGTDEHPLAGQGYVQEVSNILYQHAQQTGRGYRCVVLDYAGLSCDRYMAANNMEEGQLRHLLRRYGEECKKKIAERFNCTVWVLQQIRGEACNKNPTALLHHNDAAESKSFAENMALCACIGSVDRNTGCRMLNFSKVRYKPQERVPPATFRIHERFAIIEDMTNSYVADGSGSRFVPREDAERIRGREQRAPTSGPNGMRRVLTTAPGYDPLLAENTGMDQ